MALIIWENQISPVLGGCLKDLLLVRSFKNTSREMRNRKRFRSGTAERGEWDVMTRGGSHASWR
jgi:hypothetical protein